MLPKELSPEGFISVGTTELLMCIGFIGEKWAGLRILPDVYVSEPLKNLLIEGSFLFVLELKVEGL